MSFNKVSVYDCKTFFQEMSGRTLSLPRKHDYEGEVGDGFHKSSQKRTRSRQNLHANGTFSLHGTLRRNHSNGQFNTTLEDDVFEILRVLEQNL